MLRIAEQFITTYMKDVQSVILSYFQFLNATLNYTYLRQLCLSKLYQTPSKNGNTIHASKCFDYEASIISYNI